MRPPDAERRPLTTDGAQNANSLTVIVPDGTVSASPLRAALDRVIAERGGSLKDLTVLGPQRDPFRLDTPANHRLGRWLAETMRALGLADRRIHPRGLHYVLIGRPKPDGSPYANSDADWIWSSEKAVKAARWLGYVPFGQITDQRNAEPVIREYSRPGPWPYLTVGIDVDLPDADEILPEVGIAGFEGSQAYRIVIIGEKSSLADVLGPIAQEYSADLYLPTGEMSDTLIYRIAETAAADGRPMVVLYFADCDPAGWQMIVSVSRKLQALKILLPGMPDFEACRAALTPAQVGEYGLPSTPLKATEKKADKWRAAFGVEQTEIDALASLRPDLLRQIARDAIAPFFDRSLSQRVFEAKGRWLDEAGEVISRDLDIEQLGRIRAEAASRLADMAQQVADLNDQLRIDVDDFDLPPAVVPEAEVDGSNGLPLLDSRWDFAGQCRALIASKAYESGDAP